MKVYLETHSFLSETSQRFYPHASDTNETDPWEVMLISIFMMLRCLLCTKCLCSCKQVCQNLTKNLKAVNNHDHLVAKWFCSTRVKNYLSWTHSVVYQWCYKRALMAPFLSCQPHIWRYLWWSWWSKYQWHNPHLD